MNILEKAKKVKNSERKSNITDEEIEYAIAWMKGEVNINQLVITIYGNTRSTNYSKIMYTIAKSLKEAYKRGLIK